MFMLKFFKNKIFIIIIIIAVGLQIYTQSQDGVEEREVLFASCPVHYDMSNIPKNVEKYDLYLKKLKLTSEETKSRKYYIKDLKYGHLGFDSKRNIQSAKRLGDDITDNNNKSFMGRFKGDNVYYDKNGNLLYIEIMNRKNTTGFHFCRYDKNGELAELSCIRNENYYTYDKEGKKIFSCYKYHCDKNNF